MDNSNSTERQEEIYSQAIRAGKRTYFFDVKATKADEMYLTITESKRRYNTEEGKFEYEKHKLFLFKEDFEKFTDGLNEVINFISTGQKSLTMNGIDSENEIKDQSIQMLKDVSFEDLD